MAGVSRDRPGSIGTSGSRGSSRDRGGPRTAGVVGSTSPREGSPKKKKKKVYKRTIPRYGTHGYSSSYSDLRTKKKVVDLGSSI